jgi:hypothetical protein
MSTVSDVNAFLAELDAKGIKHGKVMDGVIFASPGPRTPAGNVISFAETKEPVG